MLTDQINAVFIKLNTVQKAWKKRNTKHFLAFAVTGNKGLWYQVYGTRHAENSKTKDQELFDGMDG
jgi:hypothetical protein